MEKYSWNSMESDFFFFGGLQQKLKVKNNPNEKLTRYESQIFCLNRNINSQNISICEPQLNFNWLSENIVKEIKLKCLFQVFVSQLSIAINEREKPTQFMLPIAQKRLINTEVCSMHGNHRKKYTFSCWSRLVSHLLRLKENKQCGKYIYIVQWWCLMVKLCHY